MFGGPLARPLEAPLRLPRLFLSPEKNPLVGESDRDRESLQWLVDDDVELSPRLIDPKMSEKLLRREDVPENRGHPDIEAVLAEPSPNGDEVKDGRATEEGRFAVEPRLDSLRRGRGPAIGASGKLSVPPEHQRQLPKDQFQLTILLVEKSRQSYMTRPLGSFLVSSGALNIWQTEHMLAPLQSAGDLTSMRGGVALMLKPMPLGALVNLGGAPRRLLVRDGRPLIKVLPDESTEASLNGPRKRELPGDTASVPGAGRREMSSARSVDVPASCGRGGNGQVGGGPAGPGLLLGCGLRFSTMGSP